MVGTLPLSSPPPSPFLTARSRPLQSPPVLLAVPPILLILVMRLLFDLSSIYIDHLVLSRYPHRLYIVTEPHVHCFFALWFLDWKLPFFYLFVFYFVNTCKYPLYCCFSHFTDSKKESSGTEGGKASKKGKSSGSQVHFARVWFLTLVRCFQGQTTRTPPSFHPPSQRDTSGGVSLVNSTSCFCAEPAPIV